MKRPAASDRCAHPLVCGFALKLPRRGLWARWGVVLLAALLQAGLVVQAHAQQGGDAAAVSAVQDGTGQDSAQDVPEAPSQETTPAVANPAGGPQPGDPPSRVARLGVLNGDVSAEPAGANSFTAAEPNDVLTSGDRLYTGPTSEAELQAGQIAVRLGGGTDLTVTAMTDALAQFGLASGSVHVRSFALDPGSVLELDSPDAAVTVLQAGDVRVDVDTAGHTTTVAVIAGQVQVDSPTGSQVLEAGQRVRLHAADVESGTAAFAEPVSAVNSDNLDDFSGARDSLYATGQAADAGYVSPDTTGSADLASFGSWDASDFGPIWYPAVAETWRPYCWGHWRYVAPWGWTWVGSEPWGFAPFHYGRWAFLGGRWGWIPGSPVVRPVYAPALVAFVGGGHGAEGAGTGLTAWFPLGPRESYTPPYRGSIRYLNRVNASNLYNANPAEVRAFYNQRAVAVYAPTPGATRTFADRAVGTVAVSQAAFAAGRPVPASLVRPAPELLSSAVVQSHPLVSPARSGETGTPALALPPRLARPVVAPRVEALSPHGGTAPSAPATGVLLFHHTPPNPLPVPAGRPAGQGIEPGRPVAAPGTGVREMPRPHETAPRAAPPAAPSRAPAPAAAGHAH